MMVFIQHAGAQDYFSSASDFARLYVGTIEPQYPKSLWHDVPYYKDNTDLYQGRISYYGVVYDHVQLRFDQFMQRVVVLSPVGNYLCLPEKEHVDWFEMDGHLYVRDPEDNTRYAYVLSDGSTNGVQLYHSVWKINSGDKTFGGKYRKTLATLEHYTLVTPDGAMHHVKRAADVAKLFPEQKKQVRQFVRKNGLSFSKREREQSLVKVVGSISGAPLETMSGERKEVREKSNASGQETGVSPLTTSHSPLIIDEKSLVAGIPVLDSDSGVWVFCS